MSYRIKKAAVVGSGVMGSGIAAHLANIGIPTIMLDIVPNKLTEDEERKGLTLEDKAVRNRLVSASKQALLKRSEEHTSELQSRFDLVCRLLLEKKKKQDADVT